jgi:phosphate transport system substrate-binding protein
MKSRKSPIIVSIFLTGCLVIAALLVSGCTGNGGPAPGTPTPTAPATAVQKITVTGSTTVLPIAEKAKEAFEVQYPYADIQISGGGSSVGVKAAGEGTADIGMSSRDMKAEENTSYPDLVKHEIAYDAIVIIVNSANPVQDLTLDQIRGIYNGTITNWNQVGGANQVIVAIGRDSASGTREYFFESIMKKENFTAKQEEFNSNGGIQQKVMQTPAAIGYVGLAYTDGVNVVKIRVGESVVEPTIANILQKDYPVSRPLFMVTKGQPSGLAKMFIDFILSPDGQEIVEEAGFVPLP